MIVAKLISAALLCADLAPACMPSAFAASEISKVAQASEASAGAAVRWTFDGAIHNNSLAISPDQSTAVVSYSERPDVLVYDLVAKKVRARLHGYITPRNIVFDPSGKSFYISDSSLGQIRQIDTASLQELATLPAGAGVFGTTLSRDGTTLYANNEASNTVTRFDLTSNHAVAIIPGFSQPRQGVRLNPAGDTLFVTNFLGDKITLVDTGTNKITGEIVGFNKIRAISITQDGETLYAANSGSNSIAVVDIKARKIVKTIPVGKDPYGAALTPDERALYSGNLADNSLSVITLPTQQVTATVDGFKEPRQAIVFTSDSKNAYVLNVDLSVSKVDLGTNKIVETLSAQ